MYWLILICFFITILLLHFMREPINKNAKENREEREYQKWKAAKEHERKYADYIARRELLFRARYEREMKEGKANDSNI